MLRKLSLLVILLFGYLTQSLAGIDSCNKVVISGDVAWPPYSFRHAGVLQGVGIELAQMLFGELDVPIEVKIVDSASDLGYMLRHGEVDLIVGTYDVPEYKYVVQLLTPAYFDDVVSIVVPSGRNFKFDKWEDLNGKAGITADGGQIGSEFTNYAADNLYVKKEDSLKFVLKKLQKRQVDYAVGSAQQFKAGIASFAMEKDVKFMPEVVDKEAVYFGFARVSACQSYAPYLQNRLEELKHNGTIEKLINKYTFEIKQEDPEQNAAKAQEAPKTIAPYQVIPNTENKQEVEEGTTEDNDDAQDSEDLVSDNAQEGQADANDDEELQE